MLLKNAAVQCSVVCSDGREAKAGHFMERFIQHNIVLFVCKVKFV